MKVNHYGWVELTVDEATVERAKQMRAERDRHYGNIYQEANSDLRWVGEVGEICFDSFLRESAIDPFEWILDRPAGKPDFLVGGRAVRVGVKTVKRKVPMHPDYTAQITARHADEPVDQFFFACYELQRKVLVLLGGIERERFVREATYYGAGEKVHENYTVRQGHEIYNIKVGKLVSPMDWLANIRI
jgi:hypothetical protein